ncbi:hypothetical protein N8T08_002532 [Aspergillus melleus]|uniref:Uncharacterized protein n=1 Tax=Aspergillus melleus TaxID=138277 RepID=A0ACC3B853_9EURO|nr:hypothetical protein N8T08_002532 [Aspergillus melleus]
MATANLTYPVPATASPSQPTTSKSTLDLISPVGPNANAVFVNLDEQAPFAAIRDLFDYLHAHPDDAAQLNTIYPRRGIFKTARLYKKESDQKFTIDLSPARRSLIPAALHRSLAGHGLDVVLDFFKHVNATHVPSILSSLSVLAGTDLAAAHRNSIVNFRLCDYHPDTAAPDCSNGCGAHTDYGTFSVILQNSTQALERLPRFPAPGCPSGRIRAARHRVRRTPGVHRLSAVLFVAPDTTTQLQPLPGVQRIRPFSREIMQGHQHVEWFKEMIGQTLAAP